jgi:hypothetical protein
MISILPIAFAFKKLALYILNKYRDDRIRTCDPLLPKQVRYQAAPHPENKMTLFMLPKECPCVYSFSIKSGQPDEKTAGKNLPGT